MELPWVRRVIMVEYNIKRYISAIIISFLAIFAITCVLNYFCLDGWLGLWDIISACITITSFVGILFVSHFWKLRIFQGWLVSFPNLNGKWEGKIKFSYDGKESSRKVEVQIKQSFCNIIVKLNTRESKSTTFCGSFNIDGNRDIKQLIYSYHNEPDPNVRGRSPLHYGTTLLEISKDNKTLTGEYWTNRNSRGSIALHKVD